MRALIYLVVAGLVACGGSTEKAAPTTPAEPTPTPLAPAADKYEAYCAQVGGRVERRDVEDAGEVPFCQFGEGAALEECELEVMYREGCGDAAPPAPAAAEPIDTLRGDPDDGGE